METLLNSLTTKDALAYSIDPEKWTHVTDNHLDPAGLRRTEANVIAVENRLIEILERDCA
jgi:hypothetical protein